MVLCPSIKCLFSQTDDSRSSSGNKRLNIDGIISLLIFQLQANPGMAQQMFSNPETLQAYMQITNGLMSLMRTNPEMAATMFG